jgi:hypothetical protein
LTHFTGLAYKDTNEVIVSNFLDWYANQTFGRSSATTPPVDMVFDTKTNTFLEQVPNIAEKFDMSTWAKPKSMGSPPVKPGVETSMMMTFMYLQQEQYPLIYFLSLHTAPLVDPTCSFALISIIVECVFRT